MADLTDREIALLLYGALSARSNLDSAAKEVCELCAKALGLVATDEANLESALKGGQ